MNEIKLFTNPQFGEIRTVVNESGDPLFVGNDIAKILGYAYPANAIQDHVDIEDKLMMQLSDIQDVDKTPHLKGSKITMINESGLYSLVFGSTLESAKQFKKWVTSEVLPAIRKTGGYIATTIEDTPETILAKAVLVAQDSINRLKNQLETREQQLKLQSEELKKQAPKAEYYDNVLDSEGLIATTLIAKDLGMSASALNKKLFAMNVIYNCQGTWVVTAKYQALGFAKSKSFPHHDSKGELHTSIHFYWTQKGREFIIRKLTA